MSPTYGRDGACRLASTALSDAPNRLPPRWLRRAPVSDSRTPLLDQIAFPEDLRRLKKSDLQTLADELRQETISAVSTTGGHLGAGLGVVELTVALHYVFDTPHDRLIWDVGHQVYPHKILTGRRARIPTLRQGGGLSGFTKRDESNTIRSAPDTRRHPSPRPWEWRSRETFPASRITLSL